MRGAMSPSTFRATGRRFQRGVSLYVALMALVVLGLAAVALVRSIGTGSLIIGNLGFKQDALANNDQVAEQALSWLEANNTGTTLYADSTANGYYSTSLDSLDPTGNSSVAIGSKALVDWDGTCGSLSPAPSACITPKSVGSVPGSSNTAQYVITRLCAITGDPNGTGNVCAVPLTYVATQGPNRGEIKAGTIRMTPGAGGPYYRIIVRTSGPRGTKSFTETIVYL